MVYRAAVTASYDSALFIPGDEGAAGRTHGHGYTVEAVLEADGLDGSGFVADFERAQPLLDEVAAEGHIYKLCSEANGQDRQALPNGRFGKHNIKISALGLNQACGRVPLLTIDTRV